MAREDPQLKLRLTEELKDRIVRAAAASGRSVNAEIVHALEDVYPPENTIEDNIYFARQIIEDYAETKDFRHLKELREQLSDLVKQLSDHSPQKGLKK